MLSTSQTSKPAILGGSPVFEKTLQLTVPDIPTWDNIKDDLKNLFDTGMLTKGPKLKEFESNLCKYMGVNNAIGVSSCTSGLMLIYKLLKLKGEVILPSFTFMATGQALMWMKDVTPVFVDIDPETFNINPDEVEKAITPNTTGIIGVHIYGNPSNIDRLTQISKKHNLKLVFDAAHGLGSKYKKKPLGGFGDAESFSCSPTKLLITGEGGVVATNNNELAENLRTAREYGNPGNYDSLFAGMNARMGEFNAIMGIASLKILDEVVRIRNEHADYLRNRLGEIEGLRFQKVNTEDTSSYKDFTLVIEEPFGISRNQLVKALNAENISTRNYYAPPLHLQTTYKDYLNKFKNKLPVTEDISERAVTIPLSSRFSREEIEKLALSIEKIHKFRTDLKNSL